MGVELMYKTTNYEAYWMNYLPLIVGMYSDNHVFHTFLSSYLSFPSVSPITILITPTNNSAVLLLASQNDFKTTPDIGCSEIITPQSTILCMFQGCNRT